MILQVQKRIYVENCLTCYSNLRSTHPPIKSYVIDKLKMCHALPNQLSTVLIRHASTSPWPHRNQPITPSHWDICAFPSQIFESSQSPLSHVIHHGGHFHLVLNIFIPNPISSNMPMHPYHHHLFCYFHLLNMRGLNWPTPHTT